MELQSNDFHHPYSPYDIQLQLMRALYSCLEQGKVAVFESPTGTGKSLSLICGSLTWLRDHKRSAFQTAVDNATCDDDEPEWMLDFARRESSRKMTEKRKELEERLERTRKEEEQQRIALDNPEGSRKKQKYSTPSTETGGLSEEHFALDDYDSENEEHSKQRSGLAHTNELSSSTLELLERFKGQFSTAKPGSDDEDNDEVKIFYCSRTHSQLSQFAGELRRVKMPWSVPKDLLSTDLTGEEELEERVKHVTLGSRKNLCINPRVSSLENATAINERCLDLQQPNVYPQHKCPFLPSKEDERQVLQFRDHALSTVKDIEDLGKLGKKIGICPYYASRSVIKYSEIVTLPYPLLLQRSAREALNLSVKGHVIIIDEAHNLMDAISNIHSVVVTLSQLQTSLSQLTIYARKFKTRLKGKNRSYVAQVIRLLSSIAAHLRSLLESGKAPEGPVLASELMSGKGVDQINPYKLSRYLQESKLARKVDGYVEFTKDPSNKQGTRDPTVPVLFHIQGFLLSLMNPSAEGRLFYLKEQGDIKLKYMLLDPTNQFRELVEDARAVILAGGTMSPMTDYMNHLFSYVPASRLDTFSYGHVIPPENLIAHTLVRGVQGSEFDFTYDVRDSEKMIMDLGRTIATLCHVIPDGVVAFFPSYDYLGRVLSIWKKPMLSEQGQTVYGLIGQKKPILSESRDMTVTTEELLQTYAKTVDSGRGALLLSVVGGKLSEGINFSDKLGRAVLIVGLPFPNIRSAVWQAKIQYIEQKAHQQATGPEASRQSAAKAAGRDFYENSCMRAVNQCIGRAIRHRNDYAAIVLIDRRYDKPGIQAKLPAWIKQSMVGSSVQRPAGATIQSLAKFFASKST
ncbi:DNA repair helicase [Aspergillus eucalypticola CBS 122712]|uniref:ATP-dependent DNA helicase CHL1 n=1 Tax=Aspergillus eucalypticola (strain CBS 122712 / IBT 29274) TaxID=1448314 RepID=A0A317UXX1_ASPEC|nr:DNA repair helicase [Aspergillus eucalypticola CBS 122712]PWY66189.1 DNA repair helicase [Aspergillus eucalypticola CBS 122712]